MESTLTVADEPRRFFLTKEQRRFVKFALVGGSGVLVNLGVVWLVGLLVVAEGPRIDRIAILSGILVSIFTNFLINDAWTWGDRQKNGVAHWFQRCAFFYVTNGLAAGLQFAVSISVLPWLAFDVAPLGIDPAAIRAPLASLIGIAIATPLNYMVNNLLTFRERGA